MIDLSHDASSISSLDAELCWALRSGKSKPLRTYRKFVTDEVRLPPGGKYPNEKMNLDRQPVQRLFLDELDRKHWLEIVVAAPSQSAKTWVAFDIPIAYHIAEIREDVVVGIPNGDMINDKWVKEIKPIFEAAPSLRSLLPNEGPGSKGGRVRDSVRFTNGSWIRFMTAGGSDQSKAGFTARVVAATEAAGWSDGTEASEEADPLEQMGARQRSWEWFERLTIIEGTVTLATSYPWTLRKGSSLSRILSQCPWCAAWISPERDDLMGWQEAKSAIEAAESAWFACPSCGEQINNEDRIASVRGCKIVHGDQTIDRNGVIHGDLPKSRRLWFRWSGWHNLFNSIGSLAVDEWKAAQHERSSPDWENAEKKQTQFVWATPYEPELLDAIEVDPEKIAQRRADQLPRGLCPADTEFLVMGIDLRRVEGHWVALAGRTNGAMHIPAYGTFTINGREQDTTVAVYEALTRAHQELILPGLSKEGSSEPCRFSLVLVDAGWETEAVFKAWAEITGRARLGQWLPVFGRGSAFMDKSRYVAPHKRGGGVVEIGDRWHVARNKKRHGWELFSDGDHWKSKVHEALSLPPDIPGTVTLYAGSDTEHRKIANHFANEVRVETRDPKRGVVISWERKGDQHWFDCAHYAMVALSRLKSRA